MKRMKTFFMYFLILIAMFVVSELLINAYIKVSYEKIDKYEIDVKDATVTIIGAKASREDGIIEGKLSNGTEQVITDKYMRVDLLSEKDVVIGTEYVKVDNLNPGVVKDFKVQFKQSNVKGFKISLINADEKQQIDEEKSQEKVIDLNNVVKKNEKVDQVIKSIDQRSN